MPLPKISDAAEHLYSLLLAAAENSEFKMSRLFFQHEIRDLILATPPTNPDTPKQEDDSDTKPPADLLAAAAKNPNSLLALIYELQTAALLRTKKAQDKALCWSLRPRSGAEKIRALGGEERQLYEYVEEAHAKGVWLRDMKKRYQGQMTPGQVDKIMGRLEGGRLVKSVRNVRAPAQKTYMLFHLVPGDDVTGGSFFDGGDLDESLIEEVGNLIIFHVRMMSWNEAKVYKRIKREHSPLAISEDEGQDAVAGATATGSSSPDAYRKRKRTTNDIEDSAPPSSKHRYQHSEQPVLTQLAHFPFSRQYPTAESIHTFITTTDAIRATKAQQLTVAEIQGVIDVLVWDDKMERVGGGYRTVRGVKFRPPGWGGGDADSDSDDDDEDGSDADEDDEYGAGRRSRRQKGGNGFTQAPCGRCPVFDLCGTGGPVNAGSCVYFTEWLDVGGGGGGVIEI